MLYHPCAHPMEVNKLKTLVKGCVGKHIITPSTLVPPERVSYVRKFTCHKNVPDFANWELYFVGNTINAQIFQVINTKRKNKYDNVWFMYTK